MRQAIDRQRPARHGLPFTRVDVGMSTPDRCPWAEVNPLQIEYHDTEWGVPVRDDRRLFEMLVLEGAQAGLSWDTILRKREGYRAAFAGFDPERVARFDAATVYRLVLDPGIVRHRGTIESAIGNAQALLALRGEYASFAAYVWRFVDDVPVRNRWRRREDVPATTPVSDALSRDLKRRGFRFVGSTTCYAFMQAAGLVNDHLVSCFRHDEVAPR